MPRPRLAHYELLERIGEGGTGVVYQARDPKGGEVVAIKILPEWLSARILERCPLAKLRERTELEHTNLAKLYGVGETRLEDRDLARMLASSEGSPAEVLYLVVEYVPGEDLYTVLRRGRLPVAEALRIGIQVADGLEAIHRFGLVHGDLTPGNILLRPDGRVKLVDAALVLVRQTLAVDSSTSYEVRQLGGTPPYLAPEVIQGSPPDSRSDLFALGVVLYRMLAGRAPFWGSDVVEILQATIHEEPVALSNVSALASRDLESLVWALLSKDPSRRPSSPAEVSRALSRVRR